MSIAIIPSDIILARHSDLEHSHSTATFLHELKRLLLSDFEFTLDAFRTNGPKNSSHELANVRQVSWYQYRICVLFCHS